MIVRANKGLTVLLLAALWGAAGCGPPEPTHFDESAAAGIHSLAILPMRSSSEGTGAFASGMALVHLMDTPLPQLTVTEAPALWRLSGHPTVMTFGPAVAAGEEIGVDAVLIGSAEYVPPPDAGARAMATVTVQILSVQTGQLVYENTATAMDINIPNVFTRAIAESLTAFETHLRNIRKQ